MVVAILTTDNREPYQDHANPVPHFGTAPEALLQGLAGFPELEVHVVSCLRQPVNSPEKIGPNIFFHSLVVPKRGWIRTLYQGCIRAVRRKLKQIHPDIVHGQGTERDCAISAVFSGFPNVVTIHGNMRLIAALNRERPFSYNWLAARLEGFTIPRSDGVICITNHTRQAVANLARRTWILPNAVDASFFEIHNAPSPEEIPLGLCVGTICHHKNQNNFIRALDPLARQRQFKIIFPGQVTQDAYGAEFLQLVKDRPWCEHTGFTNRVTLKEYFQRATFTALPTLEDNCPMVVLESMAAGVPVMASNVGGVPDLIQHESTGLFCDPQTPESFATGVNRLLGDPELAGHLAKAARIDARARFHPEIIARKHIEIYHEVLGH